MQALEAAARVVRLGFALSAAVRVAALLGSGVLAACATHAPTLPAAVAAVGASERFELEEVPFFAQDEYQCGPAALATVLVRSGVAVTPAELMPQVYLPERRGSLQVELVAATRRHDRIPYSPPPRLAALVAELAAGRPVLVLQNLGLAAYPVWHFAVVIGYSVSAQTVLLRSGREARHTMSAYNFERTWKLAGGWALVALRPGELPGSDDPAGYLRAVAAAERAATPATAVAAYAAAVQRWPRDATARFGLANALARSGRLREATVEYRALLATYPEHVPALNNLADTLKRRGCGAEALATIDRALVAGDVGGAYRATIEQTRKEIVQADAAKGPPRDCGP